jgi:hypothetical protein
MISSLSQMFSTLAVQYGVVLFYPLLFMLSLLVVTNESPSALRGTSTADSH